LRPLIVAAAPGQQKLLTSVKKMRVDLQNELADVINEFGPRYYDDFEEVQLLTAPLPGDTHSGIVANPRAFI
jgi:hypothetical protein